jgi:hypothetical protein
MLLPFVILLRLNHRLEQKIYITGKTGFFTNLDYAGVVA